MKKQVSFLLLCASLLAGCTSSGSASHGNYTDEMKIPHTVDLSPEDGSDSVERQGDHKDSPYFNTLDFYNMNSTDTLTILHNFKTQQQTSEWSCGVSSALMVMNWYGKLGDYNEESLAAFRSNGTEPGAHPIIVGWNDWGGHWQVIIGYDTMGTDTTQDDVIIVADPYDTTDHNQDGYGVYGAERFLYNFTFYNFFEGDELNDMCFLVAVPQA